MNSFLKRSLIATIVVLPMAYGLNLPLDAAENLYQLYEISKVSFSN